MVDEELREHRKEILEEQQDTRVAEMYNAMIGSTDEVVVEGYDKYSKEEMIRFVNRVVKASLSLFQSPQRPLA